MAEIKFLTKNDKELIHQWPLYNEPFIELNYSIRAGGWLDSIGNNPKCFCLGYYTPSLVGFSLLDSISDTEAEFYIAINNDYINQGIGRKLCIDTITFGFQKLGLKRIFLKVRTNHAIGLKLYSEVGFIHTGNKSMILNGIMTDVAFMEIYR